MPNQNKLIGKIIGFTAVALIFYFLAKNLFLNYKEIKEYQFAFNYFYLALSFVFLILGFLSRGLVWKKIVNFLEPANNLTYFESVKIDIYCQLGRYLPGKIFSVLGKMYLARQKNISRKTLYLSVMLDAVFPIIAGFALALFLIGFFFVGDIHFRNFYLLGLLIVAGGLIISHPRVFQYLIKLFLIKIQKEPVDLNINLSWLARIKLISYYFPADFLFGLGFFCLINSITYLSSQDLLAVVGIYILAQVFGVVAFFTPGGLGVKEGMLAMLLPFYFPSAVAVLIALLARIWTIAADVLAAGGIYLLSRLKKQKQ